MIYDLPCKHPSTNVEKSWPYHEYYIGERDEDNKKTGHGALHWSGAESQERYTGQLLRDCLHGVGEYTYRHRGQAGLGLAYEGHYFNNQKFGYGLTSYDNGHVFRGLYHSNFRWGPGIVSDLYICESVGLWRGRQLMRLTWKPSAHTVAPDLMSTTIGSSIVAKHRTVLVTTTKIIGEINPALELLKQCGAPPLAAAQNWIELYPKNCTDPNSQLFHLDLFEHAYYKNKMVMLEEALPKPEEEESESDNVIPLVNPEKFYAWNNNEMIIHMMKHSYLHEYQRKESRISLQDILNGPRTNFKPPAQHELDCRTILLASYLGHIRNIAQFINEYDVNPNVTDMVGNSAIMYAACGNQSEVIHFLVEAGARINDYNDSCCTPLGVVLLIYACINRNVPYGKILHAVLPPAGTAPIPVGTEEVILEWQIKRNENSSGTHNIAPKTSSNRTLKSIPAARKLSMSSKKTETSPPKDHKASETERRRTSHGTSETVTFSEDKRLYYNLINEYHVKINELMSQGAGQTVIPYIFEVNDMVKEVEIAEAEELRRLADKKDASKSGKISRMHTLPIQQEILPENEEIKKEEQLKTILTTIEGLLLDGADPRCVNCPQPALAIAIAAQCPVLVRLMIKYGADAKEEYPQQFGYSLLDTAISGPLTERNLDIIRMLLENGANADHRIPIIDPFIVDPDEEKILGPTLLHVVLAKRNADVEANDDVREQVLELLLEHGSDPLAQYNGRSAMDMAMSTTLTMFDILIESPHTDLNAPINNLNQTVLVKMFYMPFCKVLPVAQRLLMITNLLLFGADPLIKCQSAENEYENLFVFTKKIMADFFKPAKPLSPTGAKKAKSEMKAKKPEPKQKPKPVAQTSSKSTGKAGVAADEQGDYKQTVSLVTNTTRIHFIRWLQAKLMKELIHVVDKYKHRHWNMILKEYKNGKRCGLWLNPVRCLEIWDILKTTKKKKFDDNVVLKHVLYIVQYYLHKRMKILTGSHLTMQAKTAIELKVASYIRDHNYLVDMKPTPRPYAMPELTPDKEASKFNICFECAVPLEDAKIPCASCRLLSFCTFECMGANIERDDCHPCSNYLKKKYFPTPETSEDDVVTSADAAT